MYSGPVHRVHFASLSRDAGLHL